MKIRLLLQLIQQITTTPIITFIIFLHKIF